MQERICTISRTPGPDSAYNYTFSLDGEDVLTVSVKPGGSGNERASIGVWRDSPHLEVVPASLDGRLLLAWSDSR